MSRYLSMFALLSVLVVGCEAPEPPQPEPPPPELTGELARVALVEMFRKDAVLMDGIRYEPEKVAAFPLRWEDDDHVSCGPFGIWLKGRSWSMNIGDGRSGYTFTGKFEAVSGQWVARLT